MEMLWKLHRNILQKIENRKLKIFVETRSQDSLEAATGGNYNQVPTVQQLHPADIFQLPGFQIKIEKP